jgi:fumarate reductase iron-sulfur subunit
MGAVALNRIARFVLDPRDQRTDKEYFDIIGTDKGIFGCMGLLACGLSQTSTVTRSTRLFTP